MKIKYRLFKEYLEVDLNKLRPKSSYKNLIDKRSYPIDQLVKKFGEVPDEYLNLRNCPNCGEDNFKDEIFKDHLTIVKCQDCEMVYTNPIFNEDHYREIYESSEYQDVVRDLGEQSHEYRVERFGKERVEALAKYVKAEDKDIEVLDVGCSTGFFVEAAIKNKWNAEGIDLNPSAIEFGKKRGLKLKKKELSEMSYEKKFNIITLFDVLEHLIDPGLIVNNVNELLKDKGLMSLYVPNYDSASRYLMNEEAHFIWPSHHLTYFTIKTISDFLNRRGFKILEIKTEGLDIFDYIWWESNIKNKDMESFSEIANRIQFFINAGGYGKNLRVICQRCTNK